MNRKSFIASLLGIAGLSALKKEDFNVSPANEIKSGLAGAGRLTAPLGTPGYVHVHDYLSPMPSLTKAQRLLLEKHIGLIVRQTDEDAGVYIVNPGQQGLIWAKLTYA